MSRLILYAGPNGAGKSSLRDTTRDNVDIVIDSDQIARTLKPDEAGLREIQAGRMAIQIFQTGLNEGKSMSLESTLTGNSVLHRLAEARAAGYDIELRFVALDSAADHVARVAQRVREGGHAIPPETVVRRYERSLANLPEALRLAHRGFVVDNSGIQSRDVLRTENGSIIFLHPELPPWLAERLDQIKILLRNQP